MLRIMSFVEPATSKELVLPVTPAEYFWRHPTRIETVRLDRWGRRPSTADTRWGTVR